GKVGSETTQIRRARFPATPPIGARFSPSRQARPGASGHGVIAGSQRRLVGSAGITPPGESIMDQQQQYVGLDVSLDATAICVIDDKGAVVWHGKYVSTPEAITAAVATHATTAVRVGLETGQLSNWLTLNLRRRGVPVVCLDARHAKAALSLQINKTDANDAFGLAQIVRTGWYREVAVKSMDAQTPRMLLVARSQPIPEGQKDGNTIRGLLKTFGLVIARGSKGPFSVR